MVRLQYKRYSLEVELKFLYSPHDCKAFLLDGGVVPLCRRQFLAAVAHRVGLPVLNLHQHCADSTIRRISPKDESPLGVGQSQDGSPGQQNSHGLGRALLGFLPLHCIGLSLLQQVRQWHFYSCEVGDIFPIVVGKSREGADLFLSGRSGCFHDLPHVVIVQSLHTFTQPMSNEVDVIGPQNTFAGPNGEVSLLQSLEQLSQRDLPNWMCGREYRPSRTRRCLRLSGFGSILSSKWHRCLPSQKAFSGIPNGHQVSRKQFWGHPPQQLWFASIPYSNQFLRRTCRYQFSGTIPRPSA